MSYKIILGAVPVQCDTLDELMAAVERATGNRTLSHMQVVLPDSQVALRPEAERIKDFLGDLTDRTRKLLARLAANENPLRDDALRQVLKLKDNRQVGGIVALPRRKAPVHGFQADDILKVRRVFDEGKHKRVLEVQAGEMLRKYGALLAA